MVLVPVLAIYAALGAAGLPAALRDRKPKRLSGLILSLLLLTALGNLDLFNQERIINGPIYRAQAPFTLGRINLDRNDPQTALQWLAISTSIDPLYPDAWVDTGRARYALKNLTGAISAMNQAVSAAPDYPLPYYNLALIFDNPAMPREKALRYYREFLTRAERYFEQTIRGPEREEYARRRIAAISAEIEREAGAR